jgi:carbon monoxide dehydrogenase subunit G
LIEVTRRVRTSTPVELVSSYLSDFTTTVTWDPHTASCRRVDDGPIAVGSVFDNVQRIGPMRSRFRYRVEQYEPGSRIVLTSQSGGVDLRDTMTFAADRDGAVTTVTYTARLRLKGVAKVSAPIMRRLLNRIADQAAAGMQQRLDTLVSGPGRAWTSPA